MDGDLKRIQFRNINSTVYYINSTVYYINSTVYYINSTVYYINSTVYYIFVNYLVKTSG